MLRRARSARLKQGHRTMPYPDGPPPTLPDRFRGLPVVDASQVPGRLPRLRRGLPDRRHRHRRRAACSSTWAAACSAPTAREACPEGAIRYTTDYRLAARPREDLVLDGRTLTLAEALGREDRAGSSAGR